MLSLVAGQGVRLLPGAAAGEGVACCVGRRGIASTTRGDPSLGVEFSPEGKVGEGAEMAAVGVEKLRRLAVSPTSSHQNH